MLEKVAAELSREQVAEFSAFYKGDYKPLVLLLIRLGAAKPEAEDVAQDAMRVALEKWPTVRTPKAFVRTVAHRTLYRAWDGTERERAAWQRVSTDTIVASFDVSEDSTEVLRLLQALPPAQRLVVLLRDEGYETAEITEITGQSPSTVRSNLRHARQKLIQLKEARSTKKEASRGS
ncbi:RNA polymerase sigma factor [Micromonospora sp. NPDC049645]|uniref:RNA polymerase sigma factor n=1 Tax=Micromonospora sp. NPDC049645 TaxID=3155508 RepID=UPI0034474D33